MNNLGKRRLVIILVGVIILIVVLVKFHFFGLFLSQISEMPIDPERLDEKYYTQQRIFSMGISAEACQQYLNNPEWREWHDDLLYRLALLRQNEAVAKTYLQQIIDKYPAAILEQEIMFIGTPSIEHSNAYREYIRAHPNYTAEKALYTLAHKAAYQDNDPRAARAFLDRLLANEAGYPRYDDTEYNQGSEAKDMVVRPYVVGAEMLMTLTKKHWPNEYRNLLSGYITDKNLPAISSCAMLRLAEDEYRAGNMAETKALATRLVNEFPKSEYLDDANSLLRGIEERIKAKED